MDSPRPRPVGTGTEKQQSTSGVEKSEGQLVHAAAPRRGMDNGGNDGSMAGEEDMPPLEDDGVDAPKSASTDGGDIFLILDLPANSTVGCDAKAISTGPAVKPATSSDSDGSGGFHGIRDIPPGTHFVWVSEPNAMSRCGYWFVTDSKENGQRVRVKQWDKFNEVLVDPASQFEARDHKENVASLYHALVPYGFEGAGAAPAPAPPTSTQPGGIPVTKSGEAELWERLTCCISEKVLSRVTGKPAVPGSEWLFDTADTAAGENGGVVGPTAASYLPSGQQTTGAATNAATNGHKAVYQTIVGSTGELNFLFPEGDVDLHEYHAGRANTEQGNGQGGVTTQNTSPDTSLDIIRLIDTPGTGVTAQDIVGELQVTFLTGLHLSNLSCVDQWWHLVLKVFLRAHELVIKRPSLSLLFLRTLYAQVVYNEEYIAGGSTSSPSNKNGGNDEEAEQVIVDVRHEYGGRTAAGANTASGGAGDNTTSLLDIVPGNKKKLRTALTLYKRRMNEILLDFAPGHAQSGAITSEQTAVGQAFAELEAWFWRMGWDLRTDYVNNSGGGNMQVKPWKSALDEDFDVYGEGFEYDDVDDVVDDDDDDEYKPVIVDLDEDGREVGMVSFN